MALRPLCYFGWQGITTPDSLFLRQLEQIRCHWQQCYQWSSSLWSRKYLLLHLLVLLDLRSSPTVLPSPLSHAVETDQAHHKRTRTKTRDTIMKPIENLPKSSMLISLWWTCRESNPGPTCLHFEGITTIKLFKHLCEFVSTVWCAESSFLWLIW